MATAKVLKRRKPRTYYTLVRRDDKMAPWSIEFGAYDKADVEAEMQECRDYGQAKSNLRIITTDARQASIDEAVRLLNVK